ncbi:polyphosphate polymerase domain-containing protein [Alkalibacter sp. M17DMB]|nr:polyphosphate polymerase domain-containing protein [Alkalibacter mobilis]
MEERQYRNEKKHIISQVAKAMLSSRLSRILKKDEHASGDTYLVKSLYFDTVYDEALNEKLSGDPTREKFRIRFYNNDIKFLRLEKKVKFYNKGYKLSAKLEEDEAEKIIRGDLEFLKYSNEDLLREFYIKNRIKLIKPKVVIAYEREAYIFRPGNTRVTLDFNIKSSMMPDDFFCEDKVLMTTEINKCVLEVKFDQYIPDIIRDLVQIEETTTTANSKYVSGRALMF